MSYSELTNRREIAAPKKLVPIPLVAKDSENTAAMACVISILSYYGYDTKNEEWDRSAILKATQKDGTGLDSILSFLNQVKAKDTDRNRLLEIQFSRYMTVCDLMEDIDQGIPVICPIQAWYEGEDGKYEEAHNYQEEKGYGHYVVAIGYDRSLVYFMDPAKADTYMHIPICELDARWHGREGEERYERCGIRVKLNSVARNASYTYKIM